MVTVSVTVPVDVTVVLERFERTSVVSIPVVLLVVMVTTHAMVTMVNYRRANNNNKDNIQNKNKEIVNACLK